jgi:folate-binding protein YgfZ
MHEPTQSIHAALLPFLGVLRFYGDDAARFLQGQVTHDTRLLADGRTLLAACNTPQGRVIALLRLKQTEDAVYALLPADLLEHVASRLRRFVLRARVDVQIAADLQVAWVGGQPFSDTLAVESYDATRTLSAIPQAGATEVVSFDYGPDRQVVAAPGAALRAITGLSLARSLPGIEDEWWAADIAAGMPQVFRASTEQFVPQMLNLDRLDGISFDKGCYTGQEIVARTQHLGRIKRRTLRYRVAGGPPLAPLAGLHLEGAKVAEVVMSAPRGAVIELLAVTALDARDRTLVTEDGREAVPVAMPDDVRGQGTGDRGQ